VRLRAAGWTVWRLPDDMAWHDAAMTRFSQWWRRAVRAGFAFAEGAHLHGRPPERHWVRESRSALRLGPGAAAGHPAALRWRWPRRRFGSRSSIRCRCCACTCASGGAPSTRAARAFFLVLGKFAEAFGELRYAATRRRGAPSRLIEYK
jgi:hypothetical protein